MSLAKEHEELLQILANERSQRSEDTQRIADQFRSEIKLLEDKVKRAEEDTTEAQSKRGMAIGMLSLYQNKIVQLNEENNKLSKQLLESNHTVKSVEDQVKTLEALTASQRGTIESLTASKAAEAVHRCHCQQRLQCRAKPLESCSSCHHRRSRRHPPAR